MPESCEPNASVRAPNMWEIRIFDKSIWYRFDTNFSSLFDGKQALDLSFWLVHIVFYWQEFQGWVSSSTNNPTAWRWWERRHEIQRNFQIMYSSKEKSTLYIHQAYLISYELIDLCPPPLSRIKCNRSPLTLGVAAVI